MERREQIVRMVGCIVGVAVLLLPFSYSLASTNSTDHDREYIVEHNLFSPDRQYTPEKQGADKKVAKGPLKLLGITIVGDLREAVISIKGANPPVVVLKEGEEANGCKLVKVTSKDVVVERNGKEETLVFEEYKGGSSQQTAAPAPAPKANKKVKNHHEREQNTSTEKPANGNPFFKIIESVRKNAGKRGREAPPALFPVH